MDKILDNENIRLECGDCLEKMKDIEDKSIDAIICDPPFGTISCKWDNIIPFDELWKEYNRIIKDNGAIVLFCQQPFTSNLISSNIKYFKYMLYWEKSRPSGYVNAKLKPLKNVEEIAIFSKGTTANGSKNNMIYNPQNLKEVNIKWHRPKKYGNGKGVNTTRKSNKTERDIKYGNYPRQILKFSNSNHKMLHPTQKPVDLLEYLIKTYTNEGETVLDNTMGSGSTGVACVNINRKFIGIELDENYFNISCDRIDKTLKDKQQKLY